MAVKMTAYNGEHGPGDVLTDLSPFEERKLITAGVGVHVDDDELNAYDGMTVPQLREELHARKLEGGGVKAELIARLVANDAEKAAADL